MRFCGDGSTRIPPRNGKAVSKQETLLDEYRRTTYGRHVKSRGRKLLSKSIAPAVILTLIAANFYHGCKPTWQFDHLEQNARKVVTGSELQMWATNLLAQCSTNATLSLSELGTNFPQQLLDLAPKLGPYVWVYEGLDQDSPAWVRIHWGSGFLGTHGFEIGPTNFISFREGHTWQPGVYFYYR